MKQFIFAILSLSILGLSCTKDITRFNEQTKKAAEVPGETLFSFATHRYVRALATPNVNRNVFRFTVGYWAATTYQDEPNYDFVTRNIPGNIWTPLYRDVLSNLQEAKQLITEEQDPNLTDAIRKNKLAQIDIMAVNAWYFLVTTFGNIPYSEALKLDEEIFFPKYEDAQTIYSDLLTRMQANVEALNPAARGITDGQDLIFGGDVAKWKAFGNSLLLRMAMTIADADAGKAKSIFEAANAGAFGEGEAAMFEFLANPPNTNPLWEDIVESGRQDYVAGRPLLTQLVAKNDPRLDDYFRVNNDGNWVGGVVGSNNTFANTSKPSELFQDPTMPYVIIGYSELEFLRAEAIERGFSIPGSAAEHYANGITASILYWGGTKAEATTYTSRTDVAYATAPGDWKQKIGYQKWIALYGNPVQSWIEIRRLDHPNESVLPEPAAAKSGFPNRLPYPQSEQSLNPDGYASGAQAIGGDKLETKLWWDKF